MFNIFEPLSASRHQELNNYSGRLTRRFRDLPLGILRLGTGLKPSRFGERLISAAVTRL